MAHYVYMVECWNGAYYTGYTIDLEKRMKKHKAGKGSKYVKSKGFKKLVYSESYPDKITAMKREYVLKKSPRIYKENLVINQNLYKNSNEF
ncbi:GIY-YIG nuclease family protein [Candidatus Woesearchaeota archaeon]|jgi:putative endonuclease|nr:GIY-YIG nuclease family protein [Candidatus Woesearchaeota archaeon]MBT4835296.1 GIY-YIG nuclease family protein [Candidatus Woesearchaeota archaeon]MBT6735370.1 GIY-YIG nuclease family protein [Candidatus Woesearchaeota archaeon]MBT7169961.1 GIY-YIG nuclease family protein [Candidatus Woesearchaeota archaeon]MBT7474473.1 GIY-YIG nuclease family protein [Candidatus Woesearchaeota archaeon]